MAEKKEKMNIVRNIASTGGLVTILLGAAGIAGAPIWTIIEGKSPILKKIISLDKELDAADKYDILSDKVYFEKYAKILREYRYLIRTPEGKDALDKRDFPVHLMIGSALTVLMGVILYGISDYKLR